MSDLATSDAPAADAGAPVELSDADFAASLEDGMKSLFDAADAEGVAGQALDDPAPGPDDTTTTPDASKPPPAAEAPTPEAAQATPPASTAKDTTEQSAASAPPKSDPDAPAPLTEDEPSEAARALLRENRALQAKLDEQSSTTSTAQAELDRLRRVAAVQGVELADTPAEIDLTPKAYADLVDTMGDAAANAVWSVLTAQKAAAAAAAPAGPDPAAVRAAMAKHADLIRWEENAALGHGRVFDRAREIEAAMPEDGRSLEERFGDVVAAVKAEMAGVAEGAFEPGKAKAKPGTAPAAPPARSLGDVPGEAGGTGDEVAEIVAMGDRKFEYLDRLAASDPTRHAQLIARMSSTVF